MRPRVFIAFVAAVACGMGAFSSFIATLSVSRWQAVRAGVGYYELDGFHYGRPPKGH